MATNGYIYLVSDPRTRYVKIGFSKSPRQRLRQLNSEPTLLPEPLNFRLICAFQGTIKEEQRLHKFYAPQRIRGEWFNLCQWRYMDIVTAFEARPRLPEFDYEDDTENDPITEPWDFLRNGTCPCEECSNGI